MKTPKGQINRTGSISFGDASIYVSEEGISDARATGGYEGMKAWELAYKRQVFTRILQTLNRLGWTCVVPADMVKTYSAAFARNHRDCSFGDLRGRLDVSGRCIEFKMWQGVNTPTRPDHGGQYESDLEGCMPYILRLKMEHARRKIRDYLCNVFSGYTFDAKHYSAYSKTERCGPFGLTALEWVKRQHDESCHIKGDPANYKIHEYNSESKDGGVLTHGMPVWFEDRKGRICSGTAHVNINSMWWVVSGKYEVTNKSSFDLYAAMPDNPRVKRNIKLRRSVLEHLMQEAVKGMKFERAAKLRDILLPNGGPVFHIYHKEHRALFGPNYRGYTNDSANAGIYTREELRPYLNGALETNKFKAIEVAA